MPPSSVIPKFFFKFSHGRYICLTTSGIAYYGKKLTVAIAPDKMEVEVQTSETEQIKNGLVAGPKPNQNRDEWIKDDLEIRDTETLLPVISYIECESAIDRASQLEACYRLLREIGYRSRQKEIPEDARRDDTVSDQIWHKDLQATLG